MTTISLERHPSGNRGHTEADWLHSRHSFSFGDYYNPNAMGFGDLRVINEDWVQAGKGFGMHPHSDMEIITYLVEGELAHEDNLGNGSVIHRGEVQRMTAGAGIVHSETNPSTSQPVHLLQIWVQPSQRGLSPSYEQRRLVDLNRPDVWQLLASPDGEGDSLTIHQDVRLWAAILDDQGEVTFEVRENRMAWLQVVRGNVSVKSRLSEDVEHLQTGDALAIREQGMLSIVAQPSVPAGKAEVLLFDLRKSTES